MAISWIFWINGQSPQIWRTVNLKYLELQKCDLPFWRHLTPYYLIKKGQLPSSMFKVSNFLMKDLHFSILDVHKTILTPWASLKISTMLGASETFFLLLINANRLCLHVGLEFWTIFSFTCSESTSFTTCKFCFSTLYLSQFDVNFELCLVQ